MAKAAVTRSIRDDHQKNFLKIFNSLTGKHSRWEIWEDFVTLTAIEISNSTDTELRQTVQQHKKIAAKIRMGKSKNFRPGTLKKYQAEMEKLEAEQKKRRDELMDKGNEILAQLGEE